MIELLFAALALLAIAYWAFVTRPVDKEMEDERSLAEQQDYKELYNTDNERNYKL